MINTKVFIAKKVLWNKGKENNGITPYPMYESIIDK
jgi:hypothetical protein